MSHTHRLAPLVLVLVAAVAAGGLLAACSDQSGSGTSARDAASWRDRFAKGDSSAINELAKKDEAAVPTLVKCLGDDEQLVVKCALMTILKLENGGEDTISAVFQAFERFPTESKFQDVVKKFKRASAPEVTRLLRTGSPEMQARAAKLANLLGWRGASTVDALIALLEGPAPDATKIEAMGALASLGLAADAKARPVLEEIQAQGGELATYAARGLKRLDSAESNLRSRIAELHDPIMPNDTKKRAMEMLVTIGPPGHAQSIPAVEKAIAEQPGVIGDYAKEVLQRLRAQR